VGLGPVRPSPAGVVGFPINTGGNMQPVKLYRYRILPCYTYTYTYRYYWGY
jgi:hypothetical protein